MSKNVLLSIVIATKNRQKYCLSAVKSILAIEDKRIEVVIQDNSDNEKLADDLLEYRSDPRLVFRYTNEEFSFIDNFNASVELANGEYLCLIGDDDGINPELISVAQWAKDNNIEALVGNLAANYRWAGTGAPDTFFTKMTDSTLTITDFNGAAKVVDIESSLKKLMLNGATNYLDFLLPKLYHGMVKKDCLERIKEVTGEYIKGLSPDIYSSIALACTVNKLIYIDYPITIPGVCAESGSIKEGQLKKHSKKLEDAPHFKARPNYVWSNHVPRIYCVQTIWADSCLAALRDMKRTDLIKKFDPYMLYANILDADSSLRIYLKKEPNFVANKAKVIIAYIRGPIIKMIKNRAWGRTKKILKIERFENILNLPNMETATNALNSYLANLKIDIIATLKSIKL